MEPNGDRRELRGRQLRYLLTITLFEHGPRTIAQLVEFIDLAGFTVPGRPSTTISDALRWEISHGRVIRMGRGLYGAGSMPRQTRAWIERRVDLVRSAA